MQDGFQKNAEFDADFESVEKVAKRLMRKISGKNRHKNGVSDLYYCVQ